MPRGAKQKRRVKLIDARRLKSYFQKSVTAVSLILSFTMLTAASYQSRLPDRLTVYGSDAVSFRGFRGTAVSGAPAVSSRSFEATVSLFGAIPLKTIPVSRLESKSVMLSGEAVGIRAYTEGLLVISVSEVTSDGKKVSPGKKAGLKEGDVLLSVNGNDLKKVKELSGFIESGKKLSLKVKREGKVFETSVRPVYSQADGSYRLGLWLRDSCAGIGTLTYYDPQNSSFAILGHGIYDVDTGVLMSIGSGSVCEARICSVEKGSLKSAGELIGEFCDGMIGDIRANTGGGVYGIYSGTRKGIMTPVASRSQITRGAAQVLTTVDGEGPRLYDCEITFLDLSSESGEKSMIVKITDKELLSSTGGIVQGMSGSPIIQNGAFIGAVTHVFLNDPTRGYGIFADSMISRSSSVNCGEAA